MADTRDTQDNSDTPMMMDDSGLSLDDSLDEHGSPMSSPRRSARGMAAAAAANTPRSATSQPGGGGEAAAAITWDVEDARRSLRSASVELTRRGLKLASKWASEQLVGLPPPPGIGAPARGSSRADSFDSASPERKAGRAAESEGLGCEDGTATTAWIDDLTMYSQSLFDMGEYDRAAFTLSQKPPGGAGTGGGVSSGDAGRTAVGPPLDDLGPRGIYLRSYALYLSGERRKEEEVVELRDPLERSRVTNANLANLSLELSRYYRDKRLDAFGTHVYGMVLKMMQKQQPTPASHHPDYDGELHPVETVLVDSILLYPCNWSAWLDLAEICEENPAIHGDVEAALAPLANHWMYQCFLIHIFIEQQQNEQALNLIEGLMYVEHEDDEHAGVTATGLFLNSNFLKAMTAVVYYNMRDFDMAQHHFVELCERDPLRIDHMDVFSNILYVKECKAELSQLAHSAMRNDKYRPETCCIVGNYYSLKAQHEKAVQYFQRALKLDRTYLSAWTLMGHEFVEMKNTAAAIEAYRRAVDINPRDYRAWYGLGQTYEILSMQLYALFYYRKAAALRPYDARMWCAVGGCYISMDRRADAIRSYERAVSNHDREGIATRKLAQLYRDEGEIEKAAKCYQRHLDLRMQLTGIGDLDQEGMQVDATEAEALLFLAFYHKDNRNFETSARLCSRLLEYPGPEKEEAKALLREIRSRVDSARAPSGAGRGDASFTFSP